MKTKARFISWLVLACFVASVTPSYAMEDGSPEAVVADTIIARPACFVATILGGAFFVVALPFSSISGTVDKTAEALVVKPARATFTRPLGDLSDLTD